MKMSTYQSAKKLKVKEKALELYKQGLSLREVSRVVGMSHQWVKNAVSELSPV
jgi:transposase-like protein